MGNFDLENIDDFGGDDDGYPDSQDYSSPFGIRLIQDCRFSDEYGPAGNLNGKAGVWNI